MLEEIRSQLLKLHLQLPKNNLVVWTSGNVSIRDPNTGYVVAKPSGVRYEELTPEMMVIVDENGKKIEGELQPSSDLASHLYIFRHRLDIHGVVHTHSPYATAFALLGKSIPVFLTAHADEFGCEIPCGGFAPIGDESIGQVVIENASKSSAVLLENHGVFTIGPTGEAAVKSAVMVEEIAKTVWFALQIGQPKELPLEVVEKLHYRYTHIYGQRKTQGE